MKRLSILLIALCVLSCKKPVEIPDCNAPKSSDSPYHVFKGFCIGDPLGKYIAIFPDTSGFAPHSPNVLSGSLVFESAKWVASVHFDMKDSLVFALSLQASCNKEHTKFYLAEALARLSCIGPAVKVSNPYASAAPNPPIAYVCDELTRYVARVRVCDGVDFLVYSRAVYLEGSTPSEDILYRTFFEIYNPLRYTPQILQLLPELFDVQ